MSARRLPKLRARLLIAVFVLAGAALPLAGCEEVETEASHGYEPSSVEEVKGKEELKIVKFTAEGAKRTGVRTERVREESGRTIVPYAALLYDPEGKTYVYVTSKPREYVRERVKVDRIEEDRVLVSEGPRPGTDVVTVGAAEVYGTELEIAASH